MLCEECNMYLHGQTQWEDHQLCHKHRKATGELTHKHGKATTGEKVVIPKSTAFAIEQSALYNDATSHYVFSLYRRCLLQARL